MPAGFSNEWNAFASNIDFTGGPGLIVTSGSSAYSTYAEALAAASITFDVYFLNVLFTNNQASGADRSVNCNIGVKRPGEANFTTLITGLLATQAGGGGTPPNSYSFPVFIPAGSAIGAQATGPSALSFNCYIQVFGKPSRPELVKAGSYVTTFGSVSASTYGTAIAALSNGSKSAYTDLGAITRPHWYWQVAMSSSDATMDIGMIYLDVAVGDVSNKKLIIRDQPFATHTTEFLSNHPNPGFGYAEVPSGNVYVRNATNAAYTQTPNNVLVYAVGG